jgi:hypothetical protein
MTWNREDCKGTLVIADGDGGKSIDIHFSVKCKIDGVIDIQVQPIPWSEKTNRLDEAFYNATSYLPRLLLAGTTPDGVNLSSDKVYMVGSSFHAQKGEPTTWKLTIECTELLASVSNFDCMTMYTNQGFLRYDLPGFRCFRTIRRMTDVGEIKATGTAKIEDYNRINGAITVKLERSVPIMEWLIRADEQVDLILDIFSLAGGRYLEWVRKSFIFRDQWIKTLFRSPVRRGKPELPIFHYLNMQPVFDLSISNYNKTIKHETGFGIALELFLISSLYTESRFVTNFLALEHFVNTYTQNIGQQTLLPEDEFATFLKKEIKEGLKRAKEDIKKYRETKGLNPGSIKKAFQAISGKIRELNRYPFSRNMWKFLCETGVPMNGLPADDVNNLIKIRQTLIHSGSSPLVGHPEAKNIQRSLFLLRELLTRIFLTLLKYEGEYLSFLHGQEFIHFPSIKVIR